MWEYVHVHVYTTCHSVAFIRKVLCLWRSFGKGRRRRRGGRMRDEECVVEGLKESRLRSIQHHLSESPSPAVLLVDAHVHLPGSVFCNPPVRHQQADTCREGGMLINKQADMHTYDTHLLSCQVCLVKVTARGVTGPRKRSPEQVPL